MPDKVIRFEKVSKAYRSGFPVIKDLSFQISNREIFGLLGPNGAGKTTTLSILTGLLQPDSGNIFIKDFSLAFGYDKIKPFIGVVPQSQALYQTLTARENLKFFGKLYGIHRDELEHRIKHYMELFLLGQNIDQRIETFSEGMKRRVNMIAGLLHKPEILFLDEPTAGIDVHSKKIILDHLIKINREGTTIIYTSHHMSEAEKFCSRVVILHQGKIICEGIPKELINSEQAADLEDVFINLTGQALENAR